MNILVLGGLGFIGKNLTEALLKEGHRITVFDHGTCKQTIDKIYYVSGDFLQIEKYSSIFKNIDIVYHLISTTIPNADRNNIEFDLTTNLLPTLKMLNICVDAGVKKIIFASSGGAVYGASENSHIETDALNPLYAYGINKVATEKYLEFFYRFYGLDFTVLRISNPFGPNHKNKKQGIINVFVDCVKQNIPCTVWGVGSVERDYIWIEDVVSALILSIPKREEKIFNISSGKSYSVNEIISLIENILGRRIDVDYQPSRQVDIPISRIDNTKAKKILQWSPLYSAEDGIKILLGTK